MSVEAELEMAHSLGRWSFFIVPNTQGQVFVSDNLLYTTVPAHMARPWTVNLCQMQYGTGTLLATGNPPPPGANQVLSLIHI